MKRQSGLTLIEILIALVVVGIGLGGFLTMHKSSGSRLAGNSNIMKAGQLIEKHLEAMRIAVARDTLSNWPPKDTSYLETGITLSRTVSEARSPKTNDALPNVRKVDILTSWGTGSNDSLVITTYVAKRF